MRHGKEEREKKKRVSRAIVVGHLERICSEVFDDYRCVLGFIGG